MMKRMRIWLVSFVIVASFGGAMTTLAATPSVGAATKTCNSSFLGFPQWYKGLTKPYSDTDPSSCDIKKPNAFNTASAGQPNNGLSNLIWRIALNIVEMAVVAAAYLSGFMFLYGGWMFIISQGKPETAAKARSIMTMSAMGLVLMLSAVTLVEFIFSKVIK